MTNDTDKKIADLEREVEALKAAQPKPAKTWAEIERENAEHFDRMHQMRERQANSWMPPNAVQEMVAAEPRGFMAGVVHDNRAPTSPGTIPRSEQPSNVRSSNVAGSGTGWAHERPLGPQPGIDLIDRGVNAALPHGPEWGKGKK
jgi:hypothetical protein